MRNITKVILALVLLSFISITLLAFVYISNDRDMINSEEILSDLNESPSLEKSVDANFALIGDSWVAGEKLDQHIVKHHPDVSVASAGFPGFKSGEILEQFGTQEISSILNSDEVEYALIIAGVNDSASYIGSEYYAHHITEMVKAIEEHDINPLILELPEYGIDEGRAFPSIIKHTLYRYLFNGGQVDVINDYRLALETSLEETDLDYQIIPFDDIAEDYHSNLELYGDQFHLNEKGNELLGEHIADFVEGLD